MRAHAILTVIAASVALTGCAKMPIVTTYKDAEDLKTGALYYLPKTELVLTLQAEVVEINMEEAKCSSFLSSGNFTGRLEAAGIKAPTFTGTTLKLDKPVLTTRAVRDLERAYVVQYPPGAEGRDDKVSITLNEQGFLTDASSSSESKAEAWITTGIQLIGKLIGAVVGAGSASPFVNEPPANEAYCQAALDEIISQQARVKAARETLLTNLKTIDGDALAWQQSAEAARRLEVEAEFLGTKKLSTGTITCYGPPPPKDDPAMPLFTYSLGGGIIPTYAAGWTCNISPEAASIAATSFGIDDVKAGLAAKQSFILRMSGLNTGSVKPGTGDIQPADENNSFVYRVPAYANIELTKVSEKKPNAPTSYGKTPIALPQYGFTVALPQIAHAKSLASEITLDPLTGALRKLTLDAKAADPSGAGTAAGDLPSAISDLVKDKKPAGEPSELETLTAQRDLLRVQVQIARLQAAVDGVNEEIAELAKPATP